MPSARKTPNTCADATSLLERLERLIDVGLALSREPDHARLMEQILLGAKALTRADGGTLYSLDETGTQVRWEMIHTDSLGFAMGGTTGKPIPFPAIPLHGENGPNHHNVVTHAVLSRTTINIVDAYETQQFDFSGTRAFDRHTGYRSQSFLTVPMMDHQGTVIGVLQLLNAQDAQGQTVPFGLDSQRLVESLASQAAIALTNQRLISELKTLFESFIRLVADAIDMKSPYTGGHCQRVPVLTRLLAAAVNRTRTGPLKDFRMSESDLYELDVAAMLHDCGKITTPEYVVDKATKLETIFDRIELVEARFEILRRDREIAALRQALGKKQSGEIPAPEVQPMCDDLDFLRRANQGGEFMTETDRQRVVSIGQPT
ncbi:MAG: GAF domain-containing protein, partial [Pseudomonadota bacterium]